MSGACVLGGLVAAVVIFVWFVSDASTSVTTSCRAQATIYAASGRLSGDVNGDGVNDRVAVTWRRARDRCNWRLVVSSGSRTYAAAITQPNASRYWPTASEPALWRLAQIDGRKGNEILIAVDGGASTTAYGLFGIREGALRRLRVRPGGEFVDAFVRGGSLAGQFAFGCVDRAELVQTGYRQRHGRFLGRRSFYRLRVETFHFLRERRFDLSLAQLRRLPELTRQPFARCSG